MNWDNHGVIDQFAQIPHDFDRLKHRENTPPVKGSKVFANGDLIFSI